jgi:cytidylate kinase
VVRIQRIADRLKLAKFEASEAMAVEDARRAHWVKSIVGVDLNYPGHHDIIINTDTFSLESAAKAIVAAYRS